MANGHSHKEPPSLFDIEEAPVLPLPGGKLPSYLADHRKRLRTRFIQGGAAAMPRLRVVGTDPLPVDSPPRCQTTGPCAA